jgi:hypothetical protein
MENTMVWISYYLKITGIPTEPTEAALSEIERFSKNFSELGFRKWVEERAQISFTQLLKISLTDWIEIWERGAQP